jgi:hypothetical protein
MLAVQAVQVLHLQLLEAQLLAVAAAVVLLIQVAQAQAVQAVVEQVA